MVRFPSLRSFLFLWMIACISNVDSPALSKDPWTVPLRRQVPADATGFNFHSVEETQTWNPENVAVIICDVWDAHHCLNAVRRVGELAPRIDDFAKKMRAHGATIIHAPSDCMTAYENHEARKRARAVPKSSDVPQDIGTWCDRIPSEEGTRYPVDQSDGGEDDDLTEHAQWHDMLRAHGRNPKTPWLQQTPTIAIDRDQDYISDSGVEIWSILRQRKIEHVVLVGVHTNMCVLGRPFGLRQLNTHGMHAVLCRDLTDTMYNPLRWPYVNHFSGTDLVIDHIERYVCSTTSSDVFLGGKPFRFDFDKRPTWVVMISEDEYHTEETLTAWARIHLAKDNRVRYVFEDAKAPGHFPGLTDLEKADGLLLSVRRRPLSPEAMKQVREFVARGGAVLGIRTASHAFCLRDGAASPGLEQWPEFDAEVLGGNYVGHHANDAITEVVWDTQGNHPLALNGEGTAATHARALYQSRASLYQVSPLKPGTHVLWSGTIQGQPKEPLAWTFVRNDGGRTFYTSLGHASDFQSLAFRTLLVNASEWLTGSDRFVSPLDVEREQRDYEMGAGKQR